MTRGNRQTVYVVQSFTRTRGGAAIDRPIAAQSEQAAKRTAERVAKLKMGAIAFSRVGDSDTGEMEPPVVLAQFGEIPFDLAELAET